MCELEFMCDVGAWACHEPMTSSWSFLVASHTGQNFKFSKHLVVAQHSTILVKNESTETGMQSKMSDNSPILPTVFRPLVLPKRVLHRSKESTLPSNISSMATA